ncbi:sulfotransferase [Rhodococcus triatomae]|uniref:Trehalose 2-sulfotransferase n=1 Tax=Rhodococcus triatomae TaxID=300028 RepID=A0A1G8I7Y9_9NOCA|nr:Stf0 family sulfotransferase [Rhodococcus triatomae]QNG20984.1 sulfotransferase [Rhodococcus triatomae]QNG23101.1 sulfotransferase [Rhodococcus triatomae]SDI15095.1 LPS sulfotransferase NodH [Rhodococcus triatomae]
MATPGSYLVLASQRSGSTLLVESLRATGVAGNPEEFFQYLPETGLAPQPRGWFAPVTNPDVLELLDPLDPGTPTTESAVDWRARILRAGKSANGVWGGKLMWNQTPLLVDRAAGLPNRSGSDLRSAIDDVLGDVLWVKVTRDDVVEQAVSFWRAVQTRVWCGRADPEVDARARYHPDGIAHLVTELRNQEFGWRKWFEDNDIRPLEVGYEELTSDTTKVVAGILEALGLDPAAAPPPALEKQGDLRSNEWAERYRADAASRGLPL